MTTTITLYHCLVFGTLSGSGAQISATNWTEDFAEVDNLSPFTSCRDRSTSESIFSRRTRILNQRYRFYELDVSRNESGHPYNSFYLQSFIALTQAHDQMPDAWYNLVTIRPRSSARIEQSPPESILGTRVGNALCESVQIR